MPESLSSSQCEGALRRFWCFLLEGRGQHRDNFFGWLLEGHCGVGGIEK